MLLQACKLSDVLELARSLGVSSLVDAIEETFEDEEETSPAPIPGAGLKRSLSCEPESPVDMTQRAEVGTPPLKQSRVGVPLLHSILTQLPLPLNINNSKLEAPAGQDGDLWRIFGDSSLGANIGANLGANLGASQHQLVNLLSAAAKLKQVADKAMRKFCF